MEVENFGHFIVSFPSPENTVFIDPALNVSRDYLFRTSFYAQYDFKASSRAFCNAYNVVSFTDPAECKYTKIVFLQ